MIRGRPALALRLASLLALAVACATPRGAQQGAPLAKSDPRPAVLLGGLAREAEQRHALRGLAQLAIDGPAGSGRAKQVIVAERPARLRVEVLGVLDQTLAVLTTDGERYRLLRVPERAVDSGLVYPDLLRDVTGLAVTPERAVEILLGVPLPPAGSHLEGAAELPDGALRIDVRGAESRERLEFDADGRLRGWARLGADGAPLAEARFDGYEPLGASVFAREIGLSDRTSGAQARLRFASVELNPDLSPALFDVPRGPEPREAR